ncbi:hypothetical protein HJG60_011677 [Phyllostomus discolor]|uniref:Uncharacterized protein n=1 Tax=Phyllostomus discolor TaxID=89673 RepID=A0A833ZZG0_9CHIR|nr:hypothetical protein HJG60_011677 [Phyllostomus discolor]
MGIPEARRSLERSRNNRKEASLAEVAEQVRKRLEMRWEKGAGPTHGSNTERTQRGAAPQSLPQRLAGRQAGSHHATGALAADHLPVPEKVPVLPVSVLACRAPATSCKPRPSSGLGRTAHQCYSRPTPSRPSLLPRVPVFGKEQLGGGGAAYKSYR